MTRLEALRARTAGFDGIPAAQWRPEDAVTQLLDVFEDLDWLARIARHEAGEMRKDMWQLPSFQATKNGIQHNLLLSIGNRVMLVVTMLGQAAKASGTPAMQPRMLGFSDHRSMIRLIGHGPAALTIGRLGPSGPTIEHRALSPDEVMILDERSETVWFAPSADPVLFLRARITGCDTMPATLVDVDSGQTVRAVATDDKASQRVMMLSLLRSLGRSDAAALFGDLVESGSAAQRWAAMRECLAIDTGAALPHLQNMAQRDSDPAVRATAQTTYAMITQQTESA